MCVCVCVCVIPNEYVLCTQCDENMDVVEKRRFLTFKSLSAAEWNIPAWPLISKPCAGQFRHTLPT